MRHLSLQHLTVYFTFLLLLILTVSGCASNAKSTPVDPPVSPAPSITSLGVVSLEVFELGVVASGTFVKSTTPLDVQAGNPYAALSDQCSVVLDGEQTPPLPGETPSGAQPIDAGETIMIQNGEAPYLKLEKDTSSDIITYIASTEETLPTTPLTLDISGGEFPAFTDATFEMIPAFALTEPQNTANITPATIFRWEGSSDTGVISLQITRLQPNISVTCFAKDDGEFAFPEVTKAELEGAGFRRGELRLPTRLAARYEVRDGAALLLVTKQQQLP
jgi:hypothetical protein